MPSVRALIVPEFVLLAVFGPMLTYRPGDEVVAKDVFVASISGADEQTQWHPASGSESATLPSVVLPDGAIPVDVILLSPFRLLSRRCSPDGGCPSFRPNFFRAACGAAWI